MSNRRDILKQTLALGMAAAPVLRAVSAIAAPARPGAARSSAVRPDAVPAGPAGASVRSALRRDETIRRLGGVGFGYQMTWDAEDRQYVVVNDGAGWADKPNAFYNSRLWTVRGDVRHAAFAPVGGYPDLSEVAHPDSTPRYFGSGLLAVRGRLYQFLSTLDAAQDRPRRWTGAKLIYSDDQGRSWHNQNGTSPVVWEDWNAQSRERLAFFNEPDGCFSLLSFLQMGRDYGANRDGYIYVYGLNGSVDGRMNELVMFRVPSTAMLERGSYEYFAGMAGDGSARWVKDLQARASVHTFPRGWVNGTNLFANDLVVESWLPSVVYNEPLGLYVMTAAGIGCAPDGTEFGKPSYLGFWVSSAPWGPWRQVHEETAWTPNGDLAARAYAPRIAPGWISADGKSFWLVWSDIKGIRAFARDDALLGAALEKAKGPAESSAILLDFLRRYMPGLALNTQRVDLIMS